MYCGDETGSYIGDVGSHTCRFGYGGEDNPKFVVPSYVCDNGCGGLTMVPSCLSAERVATSDIRGYTSLSTRLGWVENYVRFTPKHSDEDVFDRSQLDEKGQKDSVESSTVLLQHIEKLSSRIEVQGKYIHQVAEALKDKGITKVQLEAGKGIVTKQDKKAAV